MPHSLQRCGADSFVRAAGRDVEMSASMVRRAISLLLPVIIGYAHELPAACVARTSTVGLLRLRGGAESRHGAARGAARKPSVSGSMDKAGKARDAKETRSAPAKPKRVTGATPKRASTARAAPRAKAAAERDRQPSPPARGKRGRFGAPTEEMPPDTARWEEPGAAPTERENCAILDVRPLSKALLFARPLSKA